MRRGGGVEVGVQCYHHSLITRFAILTAHLSAVFQLIEGLHCRWSSIDGFGVKLSVRMAEKKKFSIICDGEFLFGEISKAFRIEGSIC